MAVPGAPLPPPVHIPALNPHGVAIRASDFLPDLYDGSSKSISPKAHLQSYHDYCDLQQFTPNQMVEYFRTTLKGRAREWIEPRVFVNFAALSAEFAQHFSGLHGRENSIRSFRNLRYQPPESMESYATRITNIAESIGYDQLSCKDQFLSGLPRETGLSVCMQDPNTLQDCVQLAQRYLDWQSEAPSSTPMSFMVQKQDEISRIQIERLDDKLDNLAGMLKDTKIQANVPVPVSEGPRKDLRCFICDSPSHLSNRCDQSPNRRQSSLGRNDRRQPSPRREMRCYICDSPTHLANRCDKRDSRRQSDRSRDRQSYNSYQNPSRENQNGQFGNQRSRDSFRRSDQYVPNNYQNNPRYQGTNPRYQGQSRSQDNYSGTQRNFSQFPQNRGGNSRNGGRNNGYQGNRDNSNFQNRDPQGRFQGNSRPRSPFPQSNGRSQAPNRSNAPYRSSGQPQGFNPPQNDRPRVTFQNPPENVQDL